MSRNCCSRLSNAVHKFLARPLRIKTVTCRQRTCTFVSIAVHRLQRMQSGSNERARAFLPDARSARVSRLTSGDS